MSQADVKKIKDLHKDYVVESLNLTVQQNANEIDRKILNNHLNLSRYKNFELKNIEDKIQNIYSDYIKEVTFKPKEMHINIKSDLYKENSLILESAFKISPFYLSPINYNYLSKPGSILFKANYLTYNGRNEKLNTFLENELNAGLEYVHKNTKKSLFMGNTLYLNNNNEVDTLVKYSLSTRDVKRKENNSLFRAIFTHNFNTRPFLFRERLVYDNIHQVNLQYTHKIINNYLDEYNCSPQLVAQTPKQDSLHQLKASYVQHIFQPSDKDNFMLKVSSSLNSSVNSSFIKNKLFLRKFIYLKGLTYQFNLEWANLLNLGKNSLKVHEKLSMQSFRGVYNPSNKFIVSDGRVGDSEGIMNYLLVGNKVTLDDIPVFNNFSLNKHGFQLSPFFHFNLLLVPGIRNGDSLYYSAGFGLNFQTEAVNVELNYTPIVKKNKLDHGVEFSLNFGLD
jgi:hypothetical protein